MLLKEIVITHFNSGILADKFCQSLKINICIVSHRRGLMQNQRKNFFKPFTELKEEISNHTKEKERSVQLDVS